MTTQPTPEQLAKAPEHNLPKWSKCEIVIDTPKETPLHRFIYEYDDSDGFKSDWLMHRLELVIKDARKQALEEVLKLAEDHLLYLDGSEYHRGWRNASIRFANQIKELLK